MSLLGNQDDYGSVQDMANTLSAVCAQKQHAHTHTFCTHTHKYTRDHVPTHARRFSTADTWRAGNDKLLDFDYGGTGKGDTMGM